ncbi:hypothetical protein ACNI2D_39235, partial [Escherichia coli]
GVIEEWFNYSFPEVRLRTYIKHGGTHKEKIDKSLMFQQVNRSSIFKAYAFKISNTQTRQIIYQ